MKGQLGRRRFGARVVLLALALIATSCTGGDVTLDDSVQAASDAAPGDDVANEGTPLTTAATGADASGADASGTTDSASTAPPTTAATVDPIEQILAEMTLDQKIGQLLMPLVAGTAANDVSPAEIEANLRLGGAGSPAALIREYQLGGVIYLGHNIVDADQVTNLSSGLQEAASNADMPGLLIAIDQEGGRVTRITDGVTPIPSARSLSGDEMAIRASSYVSGRELQDQGFNVVFAPVADLASGSAGVIGDRSYSPDPAVAATMVTAAVRGFRLSGIASVAKHWPGHGATIVDSHQSLPTVDVSYETWTQRERVPFVAAIEEGVDMVMVGHLSMPGLDPSGDAASVSPVLVDQLLRTELGFEGVIVTDALDMGAVNAIERGELAVRSIEAGIDILLAPPDLVAVRTALRAALASGRITPERLDASVRRILRLKERLNLPLG